MKGVLLDLLPSLTLSPIYDGLDVTVASNVMWFHPTHDTVSRRIYRLSVYGGHSITPSDDRGSPLFPPGVPNL